MSYIKNWLTPVNFIKSGRGRDLYGEEHRKRAKIAVPKSQRDRFKPDSEYISIKTEDFLKKGGKIRKLDEEMAVQTSITVPQTSKPFSKSIVPRESNLDNFNLEY